MSSRTYKKGVATKLSANFNSTEFDCHGRGCCSQTIIDDKLVEDLQRIRNHFGKPITITSGYRCPIHNRSVSGATASRHTNGGCAADIVVSGVAPAEVAKYAESIGILGIGLYETNNDGHFVHIDTRTVKAFWYGQAQKPRTTFGGVNITNNTTTNLITNTTGLSAFILVRGNTGEAVKELQTNLISLGYSCGNLGADGVFGSSTENAVRKFQKEYGIGVDGISGYQTQTAIRECVKNKAYRVKIIANVLNVRSGAGTDNIIVSTVSKGNYCLVVQSENNWGKINKPNGWISLQYTQKI